MEFRLCYQFAAAQYRFATSPVLHFHRLRVRHITLWAMFFLVCLGLGYPTLNRYDPTKTVGMSDALQYSRLVVDGPQAAEGHWRYRVLVPFLAKPIYRLTAGRIGSW